MLLIKSLRQGGAQRQCCVLASRLVEDGHAVCVVVFDQPKLFYGPILPKSVQILSLRSHRLNIPKLVTSLYRCVKDFKPGLIYGFMSHSNLLAIGVSPFINAKIVCGIRASNLANVEESLSVRVGEWLHRKALRFCDLIITNSYAAKSELTADGLLPSKIAVVANGIDTNRFRFDPTARSEIRTELGYGQSDRVIGMFARLHPMKGHDCLLQAFSAAMAQNPSLRLLLIGSDDRSGIEKLVAGYGLRQSVTLLEQCQDIERYYSAIDMYCSASLYGEGFPNALAEAMACGLACIATDVGDSALILSNLGELLAAGNVQQLSEAISSCSSERNEAQADERRLQIVNNFGLQQLGERTMLALRKTLES
jgi:glycosyltransferase involved in cell wall biosynthesis